MNFRKYVSKPKWVAFTRSLSCNGLWIILLMSKLFKTKDSNSTRISRSTIESKPTFKCVRVCWPKLHSLEAKDSMSCLIILTKSDFWTLKSSISSKSGKNNGVVKNSNLYFTIKGPITCSKWTMITLIWSI